MFIQYASFRPQVPTSAFSVAASSGGTTTQSYPYNYFLQFQNRAGVNLLSDGISAPSSAGEKITITINPSEVKTGEEVFYFVISASLDTPQNAKRICKIKAREENQATIKLLPLSVELTKDEDFSLSSVVADLASLPNDPVEGAIAFVTSEGKFYEYDPFAVNIGGTIYSYGVPVNSGVSVLGGGFFIPFIGSDATYLSDTRSQGLVKGCDRVLRSSDNSLPAPLKTGFSSTPVNIWLLNGDAADGLSPVSVGSRYTFSVAIGGTDYSNAFAGRIVTQVLGQVNKETGVLNTAIAGINQTTIWSPGEDYLQIEEELPRGVALAVAVNLAFDNEELTDIIPDGDIQLDLFSVNENLGKSSELASIVSDLIFSNRDRFLIVPSRRLSGVATIEPNFILDSAIEQELIGIEPDTPNQIVAISGSLNALARVYSSVLDLSSDERIRAIVSTEPGIGKLVVASQIYVPASGQVQVSVNHAIAIRDDYPDSLIAGNDKGEFNASLGYLFLGYQGNIYQSNLISVGSSPQIISFTNLDDFTAIGSLPVVNPEFGLFAAEGVTAIPSSGGTLAEGSMLVYWAYTWESPNFALTKINNQDGSCIPTALYSLADALSLAALRTNNLSDLNDTEEARTNIGAASQLSLDSLAGAVLALDTYVSTVEDNLSSHTGDFDNPHQVVASQVGGLSIANNLSDLNDPAIARTNLGLGTAAIEDVGTAAGNVVQLDGSARLPAVDGSQLTNLPSGTTSPLTTKGDLYTYDTDNARIPVGANGQVLTANSATATGLEWQTLAGGGGGGFTTLTADTTINVSNVSELQQAIADVPTYNLNNWNLIIKLADGTYSLTSTIFTTQAVGSGRVILQGNTTSPANTILSLANSNCLGIRHINNSTIWQLDSLTVDVNNSTVDSNIVSAFFLNACYGEVKNLFVKGTNGGGKTIQWLRTEDNATLAVIGNLNFAPVAGGFTQHQAFAAVGNGVLRCQARTITLTSTPSFSIFANSTLGGKLLMNGNTYIGTATGVPYQVDRQGWLLKGSDTLPGNASPVVDAATFGGVS